MQNPIISEFGYVLLAMFLAIGFVSVTLFALRFLRVNRPNDDKLATYESGEEPVGDAVVQIGSRFYVIALIFLLFEVEVLFIFPWAIVFGEEQLVASSNGQWFKFTVIEMFIFLGVLIIGLAYVWAKGHLDWISTEKNKNIADEPSVYQSINEKYK